jgi:hypothetical protein
MHDGDARRRDKVSDLLLQFGGGIGAEPRGERKAQEQGESFHGREDAQDAGIFQRVTITATSIFR